MRSVDASGSLMENRHTKAVRTIGNLTVATWKAANKGGAYTVNNIRKGPCPEHMLKKIKEQRSAKRWFQKRIALAAYKGSCPPTKTKKTKKVISIPGKGLIAWYKSSEASSQSWRNSAGPGVASISGAAASVKRAVGHGAVSAVKYLSGSTKTRVTFGGTDLARVWTLCTVARYTGKTKRGIFLGRHAWIHSHWHRKVGIAHYGSWQLRSSHLKATDDWVVMCGQNGGQSLKMVNGRIQRGGRRGKGEGPIMINQGGRYRGHTSDFGAAELIMWKRALTKTEMQQASSHLAGVLTGASCSKGYVQQLGFVTAQRSLGGCTGPRKVSHCSECANRCSKTAPCGSYQCSPTLKNCILNAADHRRPPNPLYNDYHLCAKQQKTSSVQPTIAPAPRAGCIMATQSSTIHRGAASRAVDGRTSGHWHHKSCTHTHRQRKPWWRADLKKLSRIKSVTIWNRNHHKRRLNGVQVRVGNSPRPAGNRLCGRIARPGRKTTVRCRGLSKGRFVFITLPRKGILTLCEVKIKASSVPAGTAGVNNAVVPFKARYIKISPLEWTGAVPALRFDVFGKACGGWQCMNAALGLASGIVENKRLCSTMHYGSSTSASHGRLFGPGSWQSLRFFNSSNVQNLKSHIYYVDRNDKLHFRLSTNTLLRQQKLFFSRSANVTSAFSSNSDYVCDERNTFTNDANYQKYVKSAIKRHQYLQIDISKDQYITAVATQGDKKMIEGQGQQYVTAYKLSYWSQSQRRWCFYTVEGTCKAGDQHNTIYGATELLANTDGNSVKTNFIKPIMASKIRIHPVSWRGLQMALRVEVYACVSPFRWKPVHNKASWNSKQELKCSELIRDPAVAASFLQWNEGRGGTGAIYQTQQELIQFTHQVKQQRGGNSLGEAESCMRRAANKAVAWMTCPPFEADLGEAAAAGGSYEELSQKAEKSNTKLAATVKAEHLALKNANAANAKLLSAIKSNSTSRSFLRTSTTHNVSYGFKAYQRRIVKNGGLITKQLICYGKHLKPGSKHAKTGASKMDCCVRKLSKPFDGLVWQEQSLQTLLA